MTIIAPKEFKLVSVNISEQKGTIKHPVETIQLKHGGISGDAHAGDWHRQVSLLGMESIRKFGQQANREFQPGEFAENLTTEGLELYHCSPLDRFVRGDLILEVTQIGKQCHGGSCAIFREVGNCVMPKEGIFTRVVHEGSLKAGDSLVYHPKVFRTLIITLSDRASRGEYPDKSGPLVQQYFEDFCQEQHWHCQVESHLIPDEAELLKNLMIMAREDKIDFIFTTGGTGIGPRDISPDVIRTFLNKEIPGPMEAIRLKYGQSKPNALLSRSICGSMNNCLVFCLPGSTKAVQEYMDELKQSFRHMVYMLHGLDAH